MNDTPLYKARSSALMRVIAAFAASLSGGLALMWMLRGISGSFTLYLLKNILCSLCVNCAAHLLICGKISLPERRENYSRIEPFAFFFTAVLVACIASLLSKVLFAPTGGGAASSSPKGMEVLLYIAYTAILAPVAEELAFRGAALSKLSKVFGENGAALISAVFFAAYHLDITVFLYTFALGFFLAIFAQRSGSILPCIALHSANNLLTLAVGYSDILSTVINISIPLFGLVSISWLILTGRLFGATPTNNDN